MTGIAPPTTLPDWARGWNAVDVVLGIWLLLYALAGIRRGFVAGVIGLAGIVLTIFVALQAYPAAAAMIRGYVAVPEAFANIAGFFGVLVVAQVIFAIVSRLILGALAPVRLLLGPLALLDHLLGIIPALLQAVAIAALVLAPLRLVATSGPIGEAIDHSTLAPLISRAVAAVVPQTEQLAEQLLGSTPLLRARLVEPNESVQLVPRQTFQVDVQAEEQMLALLNGERTSRGLRPLAADDRLREVARQHSAEMLRLGYFSHTSPVTGSPADRLARAGLPYLVSGENLAYAPSVDLAHQGLMASPGHRANILEPAYSRVGIGVQNAGLYGRMFTQEFAG